MGSQNNRKEEATEIPQLKERNKFVELENGGGRKRPEEEREPDARDPPPNHGSEGKGSPDKGIHNETIDHPEPSNHSFEEEALKEEEGEIGQSQFSQKKTKRGRKYDKECREEDTYKDELLGAQVMIEAMMNPRFTRQKGHPSKGAANPPKGK